MNVIVPIAAGRSLQIMRADSEYRAAGQPLAGALRLGVLHAAIGREHGLAALYGSSLAAHGHRPDWNELRALVRAGRALVPRTLARGEVIVRKGDAPDGFYIVHQGQVGVAGGNRLHGAMTVVGFAAAATSHTYGRTVITGSQAVLLHLSQDEATRLFESCPIAFRAFRLGPRRKSTLEPESVQPPQSMGG
jgi:CRP-like cAMP-binding protein